MEYNSGQRGRTFYLLLPPPVGICCGLGKIETKHGEKLMKGFLVVTIRR